MQLLSCKGVILPMYFHVWFAFNDAVKIELQQLNQLVQKLYSSSVAYHT